MLVSRNVGLGKPLKISSWRKVAIGTWRSAGDPSVYGIIDADVTMALAYIDRLAKQTGERITLTHFIGRAIAEVCARHPEINCILRFGRLYPRSTVDIFFHVATESRGADLSGTTVRSADKKSVGEIAREMKDKVHDIRHRGDPGFKRMKGVMSLVPGFLAWPFVNVTGFLLYTLNLWSPLMGMPKDPFGSAMVTNIGSLGLQTGLVPLVPYSRIPLLIAVGAVTDQPVIRNGGIEIRPVSRLGVTFDHRLIDGVHAGHMIKTFNRILQDPEKELA